nr:MAG TPA: hypothetical protein [Caudoviricetes sp.]
MFAELCHGCLLLYSVFERWLQYARYNVQYQTSACRIYVQYLCLTFYDMHSIAY